MFFKLTFMVYIKLHLNKICCITRFFFSKRRYSYLWPKWSSTQHINQIVGLHISVISFQLSVSETNPFTHTNFKELLCVIYVFVTNTYITQSNSLIYLIYSIIQVNQHKILRKMFIQKVPIYSYPCWFRI